MTKILVLLGTDQHPFARLVDWADSWSKTHEGHEVLVQFGYSQGPAQSTGVDFIQPTELREHASEADVIVTHGGPGTMADALSVGRRPIVVPRDPANGEHVDDHQLRFAPWAASKGLVTSIPDVRDLDSAVEEELRHPTQVSHDGNRGESAAQRLTELLSGAHRTGPVVFVAGSGRSGSTILERILGCDSRVVTLGEVVHLWERGVQKNELCGCGNAFHECDFWQAVGLEAFGGWENVSPDRVGALAAKVDRQRWVPKTAAPYLSRATRAAIEEYGGYYRSIYAAALKVTGASIVVDSSKHPSLAMVLSRHKGIDLRVLHMVRDSMGVAYSWSKSMERPEARGEQDAMMAQYSGRRSSTMWLAMNGEAELLRVWADRYMRLSYEAFVEQPQGELERVWSALGLPRPVSSPFDHDGVARLVTNHTAAGNPSRFSSGEVTLRPDTGWQVHMRRPDRRLVAGLTLPMRARYGYLSRRRRSTTTGAGE